MKSILGIIQARMSSQRLPGKVLCRVAGKPLLEYLLDRLDRSGRLEAVVVATSSAPTDDAIAQYCASRGQACFRGPLSNVADRFRQVIHNRPCDAFVRLCADSPLIAPEVVDRAIELFSSAGPTIVTTVSPRTAPPGQSVEVIDAQSFLQAVPLMSRPEHLEHVTQYFYDHAEDYRIVSLPARHDFGDARFAIDTPDDLVWFERLIARFERPHWTYGEAELISAWRQIHASTASG